MGSVNEGQYFIADNEIRQFRHDNKNLLQEAMTLTVDNHSLHYGDAAFEGIRAYRSDDGRQFVFRLEDHLDRLFRGVDGLDLGTREQVCEGAFVRISREEMKTQILDSIQINFDSGQDNIYIRPIVYRGAGLAVDPSKRGPHYAIIVQQWVDYVSGDAMFLSPFLRQANGRSFKRSQFIGFNPYEKVSGDYARGVRGKGQARGVRAMSGEDLGISEPCMLNLNYDLAEASGASMFIVQKDRLFTPTLWDGVLDSITRKTVMEMRGAREEHLPFSELLDADEVFLAGTAAEIAPVARLYATYPRLMEMAEQHQMPTHYLNGAWSRRIEGRIEYCSGKVEAVDLVPFDLNRKNGEQTRKLAQDYQDIVRARRASDPRWKTEVPTRLSEWAAGQLALTQARNGKTAPAGNGSRQVRVSPVFLR